MAISIHIVVSWLIKCIKILAKCDTENLKNGEEMMDILVDEIYRYEH
jgi:hypothetical protein